MKFLSSRRLKRLLFITLLLTAIFCAPGSQPVSAQQSADAQLAALAPRPLITQPVDESQITVLRGNTHPLARPQFDLGTAPATLPMQRMLLVLKRSPQQESSLRQLLDNQQAKSSPSYHKWLTPQQFGEQFGPTDADLQTITAWLQSHGFQVGSTKGRTVLEFSGSASQVQEAFHTTIHKYVVNGEQHWANASDPSIPTALTPAVAGLASLNNFPRRAMNAYAGKFSRDRATGKIKAIQPKYTFPSGCVEDNSSNNLCSYGLGPYDFATIYNVLPLWNININGTGQTIAIVGESNINTQDVADFRSLFGLPANSTATGNPLNVILNGPDPGIQNDESEADIDVQWSGSVAPYATIDFVVSQSTETTAGIDLSAVYIIDNNLAPVMSESYGACELALGTAGNQFYNSLWQQAVAQGITVFIAAGDSGSAGCDDFDASSPDPAQFGLQVSGFASTPYNVAVGGTDFNDFSNPGDYWSTTNNSTTQASALGYIPETTWNDSCTNAILGTVGYSTNPETNCNDSRLIPYFVVPEGGSGGASNCTTPSGSAPANCAGGYAKPSWQTGSGVPVDGKRDLPDVSLFASNGFVGNFYIICQSDQTYGNCSLSPSEDFLGFGGTSVSSPAFAGIMALVNQQTGSRQGNANYVFYKLAAKDTLSECNSSSKPASSCIFNDVTSGTNEMPCAAGSPNCTTSAGDLYGILTGYNAGVGYDQATGLGSVNANNLVMQWGSVTFLSSTTTLNSLTPTTITHGQPVTFSVTVKPQSGTGTPTGEISLLGPSTGNNEGIGAFNLSGGAFSGTTNLLPGGTYSVTAHYPGDGTYAASDSSPISVTVNKENSQAQIFLVTFNSNGQIVNSNTNTAVYGSPYLLRVNVENSAGAVCTPVSSTGATGCPSGTVTMTDNGTTLDAGTYTLNSYGNFEDYTVQLPGGTDSVKAQYSGDNSFSASSTTASLAITPAPTTMLTPTFTPLSAGLPFEITTYIQTSSSGAGPTGTATFFSNGSPMTGSLSFLPTSGTADSTAYASATLTTTIPAPGTYTFTSTYSGDANYAAATSPAASPVSIQYPSVSVWVRSSSNSVPAGSSITLSAEVIATSPKAVPTGTITFQGTNGVVPGTVAYSTVFNTTTGNTDLLATITYTPAISDSYAAQYSGDANYAAATGTGGTTIVVGNDFTLVFPQPSVTLTPGQYTQINMIVGLQSTTSPVTFSATPCSGLPAESTCGANSATVTYTYEDLLNLTTTAPHAIAMGSRHEHPSLLLAAALAFPVLGGLLLFVAPTRKCRKWTTCLALLALMFLMTLPSCGGSSSGTGGSGGGGGGGGGTDPGTPAGTYTITVTATSGSGSAAITHTATFNLIVQ